MRKALLTGGTGFVGANLARRLLADGCEVHLLVRPGFSAWRLEGLSGRLRLHEAPLHDRAAVAAAVAAAAPDLVFHLAAHGAYSWQRDPAEMVRTNVEGTINLLDACLARGFAAFVSAGSSSEYGFMDHAPAETERPEPNSRYAVTKACATELCRQAAREKDAHIVTLRLYSVYGPYEEPGRFVPALACAAAAGRLPPLAAPETARDFVYAGDVCEAFVLAAGATRSPRGSVYNIGTGVQTTLRQAAEAAAAVLGVREKPGWGSMPPRGWDTGTWVADSRLAAAELGWRPRVSFPEGLALTSRWLLAEPGRLEFYRARAAAGGRNT
jgi:UDP-glucose 4-epimerase